MDQVLDFLCGSMVWGFFFLLWWIVVVIHFVVFLLTWSDIPCDVTAAKIADLIYILEEI